MKRITSLLVCLVFFGLTAMAQNVQISGTVTNADDGSILPGVSVVVKGTTQGITTTIDGKYTLSVPANATLVFSFIGMKTQEIQLAGQTVLDVVMEMEATGLEEVVVTAIGIKRAKKEVTYQTQQVSNEELVTASPTRAASALTGKVAGLQVNIQDNGVNPSNQILLRGVRSITGNNSALIVIDGSISTQGAFDDLNPSDIESVNVLKGATAAALYGSDAGNGALIVTTKKGAIGEKMRVGLNSSYTIEQVAYMPKFQSEYGTGWEGAYDPVENTNWGPRFDGTMRQIGPTFEDGTFQEVPYAPVQDNLRDFFQNGSTFNNTVYVEGGSDNSTVYMSFGDQRTQGIVMDDTYKRNTFKFNATKRIKNLELFANTQYFTDKTDVVGSDIGDQDRPLYWFLLNTSANIPLEEYSDWQDPTSYGYADNYYNAYYQNPYWAIGTNRNIDYTNRFIGNVGFTYDILEWLNFTTRVSANNDWGTGKNWRARQEYDADLQPSASPVSSFVEDEEFKTERYTADALLSAQRHITSDISLKVILGGTTNSMYHRWSQIRANNLSIDGFYDVSNGTGIPVVQVDELAKRTYGFFGDVTLGYKDYLFLNLSGRNDWTSTLDADNNSYFYPAFGVSFVPTDAIAALQNNDILSSAKVTYSNSTVYNDLPPYALNNRYYQSAQFPYGSINGFYQSSEAVDADISKEKINTNEVGLNLLLFGKRAWLDFAYYNTKTTDLITYTTPSEAAGATDFLTNIGELQSKGLELTVGGAIVSTQSFKWKMSVNYTHQTSIINEIKEGLDEITVQTYAQYGVYAVKDKEFPQIKANTYKRDPQGRIVVDGSSGAPIEEEGLQCLGRTTPPHIVGLINTFTYKGFSLSATLDYRTGHVFYEQGADQMEFTGRSMASVSSNRQDFVIPNSVIEVSEGVYEENTNLQVSGGRQSYWTDVYNNVKSNYVKDATALKIRELRIDYSIPSKLLEESPISKIEIGFIARNLITWLPAENMFSDPEFNNTDSNTGSSTSSFDSNFIGVGGYFQGPPTRSFGFNLNIEF